MSTSQFYSPGKLLISGEYLVLDGGRALALPTRYGQSLTVTTSEQEGIRWTSLDHEGKTWFNTHLDINSFKQSYSDPLQDRLNQLFDIISDLQPSLFTNGKGYQFRSQLDFPRQWGLGSSSTLVSNLANWAQIDPYILLERSFGGSGYDVAVAQTDGAIVYQKSPEGPVSEPVDLRWPFTDQLYFVYLNQKQDSREAIARYRAHSDKSEVIDQIDRITQEMIDCSNLSQFELLMAKHEALVSSQIGLRPVQEVLFSDYPGQIKSLGGWGGDFVLATGNELAEQYFNSKGYQTVLSFDRLIKKAP